MDIYGGFDEGAVNWQDEYKLDFEQAKQFISLS